MRAEVLPAAAGAGRRVTTRSAITATTANGKRITSGASTDRLTAASLQPAAVLWWSRTM